MQVTVLGPNGMGPDSTTFHVHASGCADVPKRKYARAERHTGEYASLQDVVEDWYSDQIFSDNAGDPVWGVWTAYASDFTVFPCAKALPEEAK